MVAWGLKNQVLVPVNLIRNIFELGFGSLGFAKKNPKNSFCFILTEIFILTELHVVVVNKKYLFSLENQENS
jgi:hypothetical protein